MEDCPSHIHSKYATLALKYSLPLLLESLGIICTAGTFSVMCICYMTLAHFWSLLDSCGYWLVLPIGGQTQWYLLSLSSMALESISCPKCTAASLSFQ